MPHTVYFALGARDGEPVAQMRRGLAHLEGRGVTLTHLSSLWETEPVDLPPGGPVYNAAAAAFIRMAPDSLLRLFHHTEAAAGRRRTAEDPWRSLDLDILLVDGLVRRPRGPGLELPHPRFHRRRFNLAPLAEIAPEVVHPVLGRTILSLLEGCADPAWVRPVAAPGGVSWPAVSLHPPDGSGKIAVFPRDPSTKAPLSP